MTTHVEMRLSREDGKLRLLSPGVGWFIGAVPAGHVLVAGETAGSLLTLGRAASLVVPAGAHGVVVSPPPESTKAPVGFGDALYELAPVESGAAEPAPAAAASAGARSGSLLVRATQSGRYYRRPAPAEPPFVAEGQVVDEGQPIGLLEVMKTFSHLTYRASSELPRRAKIVRLLAADGADVKQGDPLLEVEPA